MYLFVGRYVYPSVSLSVFTMKQKPKVSSLVPCLYISDVEPLASVGLLCSCLDTCYQGLGVRELGGEYLHSKPTK